MLTVRVQESTRGAVIVLDGELDLATLQQLERAVEPLLERTDVQVLDFDLTDLGFMDSSGLGVVLRAVGVGKQVRLLNPSPMIRELVVATGLTNVVDLDPDSTS